MKNIEMRIKIGKYIKQERLRMNLTQQVLAEKANLSVVYVSEIERGKKSLSYEALARMIQILHLDPRLIFPYVPSSTASSKEIYQTFCDVGRHLKNEEILQMISFMNMLTKK